MTNRKEPGVLRIMIVALFCLSGPAANAGDYLGMGKITFMQNAYGGWMVRTDGENTNPDN